MSLVHKVLECLRGVAPASLDSAEVLASCGVDISADAELAALVAANPKASVTDGRYTYVAAFSVSNLAETRRLIQSRPEGTGWKALCEAYPAAAADVESLAAEGVVWCIDNKEMADKSLFPRDPGYDLAVDEQLRRIWDRMEVPSDPAALQAELRRCGITPSPRRCVTALRRCAFSRPFGSRPHAALCDRCARLARGRRGSGSATLASCTSQTCTCGKSCLRPEPRRSSMTRTEGLCCVRRELLEPGSECLIDVTALDS